MTHYADRSAVELRKKCPQAFFWNRLAETRGIVSKKEVPYLKIGGETHEDFRVLAELDDISKESIAELIDPLEVKAQNIERIYQTDLELLYRRIGWVAAYAIFIEPELRKNFETVYIEHEIAFQPRPDFIIGVTPDRVLRHREGGYRVYREYKTTISSRKAWLDSWTYKPQVHLGLKVINEILGEAPTYAQIMGLMKGDIRDGRLATPLIYAWRSVVNPTEWRFDYSEARGSNWESAPVWEYPGSYIEWIQRVGEEKCLSLFPHTEPIFLNERLLNEYIEEEYTRAAEATREAEAVRHDVRRRNLIYPKNTDNCRQPFGEPCQYLAACWNASVNADPLGSGLYVPRVPHHEIEGLVEASNAAGDGS